MAHTPKQIETRMARLHVIMKRLRAELKLAKLIEKQKAIRAEQGAADE